MMLLARLQVESTRLLNRFCAVLTEKRTGFNQAEADRYLADRQVVRVQMDTPFWPVAEEMTPDIRAVFVQVLLPEHKTHDWRDKDGREWRWNNHDWRRSDGVLFHPHGLGVEMYGPFMRLDPHTSAAPNPPGASDAGPVQDPPPAPGHPDPSSTPASASVRAVGDEGSGVDSDIPQSATPERLLVMCPIGGKCPGECDRTQGGCVTIYGPVADHEEALRRNIFESGLTDFQLGYLTAVELLESLAKSDRKLATKLMDKDMAFHFFQEANSFEGTAKYMRRCLATPQQANPAN